MHPFQSNAIRRKLDRIVLRTSSAVRQSLSEQSELALAATSLGGAIPAPLSAAPRTVTAPEADSGRDRHRTATAPAPMAAAVPAPVAATVPIPDAHRPALGAVAAPATGTASASAADAGRAAADPGAVMARSPVSGSAGPVSRRHRAAATAAAPSRRCARHTVAALASLPGRQLPQPWAYSRGARDQPDLRQRATRRYFFWAANSRR